MKRVYKLHLRDTRSYVSHEVYQTLREAVNALLHSENVDLPRCPDAAFEFGERPDGVPDDFTDTKFDKYDAAAYASRRPNRSSSKVGEEIPQPEPEVSSNVQPNESES